MFLNRCVIDHDDDIAIFMYSDAPIPLSSLDVERIHIYSIKHRTGGVAGNLIRLCAQRGDYEVELILVLV